MSWENAEVMDFQVDINYTHWTASGEAGVASASAQQRADLRAAQLNTFD